MTSILKKVFLSFFFLDSFSYLILSYLILSYLILSYLILSYLILSYLIFSSLLFSYPFLLFFFFFFLFFDFPSFPTTECLAKGEIILDPRIRTQDVTVDVFTLSHAKYGTLHLSLDFKQATDGFPLSSRTQIRPYTHLFFQSIQNSLKLMKESMPNSTLLLK